MPPPSLRDMYDYGGFQDDPSQIFWVLDMETTTACQTSLLGFPLLGRVIDGCLSCAKPREEVGALMRATTGGNGRG
jgi:hypothetical protein